MRTRRIWSRAAKELIRLSTGAPAPPHAVACAGVPSNCSGFEECGRDLRCLTGSVPSGRTGYLPQPYLRTASIGRGEAGNPSAVARAHAVRHRPRAFIAGDSIGRAEAPSYNRPASARAGSLARSVTKPVATEKNALYHRMPRLFEAGARARRRSLRLAPQIWGNC